MMGKIHKIIDTSEESSERATNKIVKNLNKIAKQGTESGKRFGRHHKRV